jgi:hypothetical protein
LRNLQDLEHALENNHAILSSLPREHPDVPVYLTSLATFYCECYDLLGDPKDLAARLDNIQEAVRLTPPNHQGLPGRLQNLANTFCEYYRKSRDESHLETAISTIRTAVQSTPPADPSRPNFLYSLATMLTDRYEILSNLEDLNSALEADEAAVNLVLGNFPKNPLHQQGLARSLTHCYDKFGNVAGLDRALFNFSASFEGPMSAPLLSWKAALDWGVLTQKHRPSDTVKAYSSAFGLLPEILWAGHSVTVRQDATRRMNINEATSTATTACIDDVDFQSVVELMEQGLAIEFQQLLELKTSFDQLPKNDAVELERLSSQLYLGIAEDAHVKIRQALERSEPQFVEQNSCIIMYLERSD